MTSSDKAEAASKATSVTTPDPLPDGRAWFTAEPINVPDINSTDIHERVEVSLWVRYPIAALCFGIAFLIPATVEVPLRIATGLGLICLGLYLAREVMIWVAGLSLAGLVIWGLFVGMSALTVPAAIIVGALIIAFAIK